MHSDLIKLFVEYGFVLYESLVNLFLYHCATYDQKRMWGKAQLYIYILQFYKFFMFMTDNTETLILLRKSQLLFLLFYYCIYRCSKESCITI